VQAWSVISGAAPLERSERALDAVEEHLVSDEDGIVRLLTPPFENTPHDPGYIKGYVRGVRENGGQYTHAALWVVRAMAELGRTTRAAQLLERLTPIAHTHTAEDVARYQVEPYVVAADVYGAPPHVGRGGWTWYTGSSGWMFRVVIESILGLTCAGGDRFELRPRVPDDWPEFRLRVHVPGHATRYDFHVVNPDRCAERVVAVTIDGRPADVAGGRGIIPWQRDGGTHSVDVRLGRGDGGA
jgi:cyclic beta-1,2-glucan synthetase